MNAIQKCVCFCIITLLHYYSPMHKTQFPSLLDPRLIKIDVKSSLCSFLWGSASHRAHSVSVEAEALLSSCLQWGTSCASHLLPIETAAQPQLTRSIRHCQGSPISGGPASDLDHSKNTEVVSLTGVLLDMLCSLVASSSSKWQNPMISSCTNYHFASALSDVLESNPKYSSWKVVFVQCKGVCTYLLT